MRPEDTLPVITDFNEPKESNHILIGRDEAAAHQLQKESTPKHLIGGDEADSLHLKIVAKKGGLIGGDEAGSLHLKKQTLIGGDEANSLHLKKQKLIGGDEAGSRHLPDFLPRVKLVKSSISKYTDYYTPDYN